MNTDNSIFNSALAIFVTEAGHPDCLPEMKFKYVRPDGFVGYAPTFAEALEGLREACREKLRKLPR